MESKVKLMESSYIPGDPIPTNEDVRDGEAVQYFNLSSFDFGFVVVKLLQNLQKLSSIMDGCHPLLSS